jgi:hypothetical protein
MWVPPERVGKTNRRCSLDEDVSLSHRRAEAIGKYRHPGPSGLCDGEFLQMLVDASVGVDDSVFLRLDGN